MFIFKVIIIVRIVNVVVNWDLYLKVWNIDGLLRDRVGPGRGWRGNRGRGSSWNRSRNSSRGRSRSYRRKRSRSSRSEVHVNGLPLEIEIEMHETKK